VSDDPVRAIADAVLYEGYILWPYRRSALKNQRRFTFGGVYPPAHSARHPDDRSWVITEALLEGQPRSSVGVTVRFLQVVSRIAGWRRGQKFEPVDELIHQGERYSTWEEAREREVHVGPLDLDQLRAGTLVPITVGEGFDYEALGEDAALMRNWSALKGEVRLGATQLDRTTWRVSATISNLTPFEGRTRQDALAQAFCSTHTLLKAHGGAFVSMADPPPRLAEAAAASSNIGTWPVLVGDPARRDQMLSSPIILEDFPRVAPESPGDLFDGGEIDQLLILNILAMTDEEQAEMASSDPKAREILERTRALTPEQLMALHGTIREFGMAR
jgi:hydrogenase maturation protease